MGNTKLLALVVALSILTLQGCVKQPSGVKGSSPDQLIRITRLQLIDLAKGIKKASDQKLITPVQYMKLRSMWGDAALRHQQLIDIYRIKGAYTSADADSLSRAILQLTLDLAVSKGQKIEVVPDGGVHKPVEQPAAQVEGK